MRFGIELVNIPVELAAPSCVLLSAMVGFPLLFQQNPCWVGFGSPRSVMLPFPVAVVSVILVGACVVTVGAVGLEVVKVMSAPNVVPKVFCAATL